jgi:hypothetical protein
MHFEPTWHAEGLRWIASVLEDAAEFLERESPEPGPSNEPPHSVEQTRLRVHLRAF